MKRKNIMALILAGAMCFALLSGCGNKDDGNSASSTEQSSYIRDDGLVYNSSFSDVNMDISSISSCIYSGGTYYIMGMTDNTGMDENGNEIYSYDYNIYTMTDFESGLKKFENYSELEIPEGMEGSSYTSGMAVTDGKIWTLENQYIYCFDLPEDFDEENDDEWNYYSSETDIYYLRWFSLNGSDSGEINLNEALGSGSDYFYISNMLPDSEGNIYLLGEDGVYIICTGGQIKTAAATGEYSWFSGMVALRDGSIAVTAYGNDGLSLISVSSDGSFGEAKTISSNAWTIYNGSGDYDFYYSNNSVLHGVNLGEEKDDTLFNFINCNVDESDMSCIIPMDDGSFIALLSEWSSGNTKPKFEAATISLVDASSLPEKTTLTFASN